MVFLEAKLYLKLKASSRFLGSVSLRWAENGEPITDNRFLFNLQLESWNLELMTKNVDAKRRNEELLLFLKMESLFFRRSLKCFDEPIYGGPDQLIKGCHVPRENVERMVRAFYKKNF